MLRLFACWVCDTVLYTLNSLTLDKPLFVTPLNRGFNLRHSMELGNNLIRHFGAKKGKKIAYSKVFTFEIYKTCTLVVDCEYFRLTYDPLVREFCLAIIFQL